MDLHKLRGFHAVASAGGFTAAARKLRLTQPTLSLQVKALERELGMRLLERGPRRVTLTRQGEVLFGLATRLFETETEIDRVFRDPSVIGATRLTLATNQSIAAHILPSRLATFTARFPKAEINIHNLRTADILASVRDVHPCLHSTQIEQRPGEHRTRHDPRRSAAAERVEARRRIARIRGEREPRQKIRLRGAHEQRLCRQLTLRA